MSPTKREEAIILSVLISYLIIHYLIISRWKKTIESSLEGGLEELKYWDTHEGQIVPRMKSKK